MITPIVYNGQSATELFGRREEEHAQVEETVKAILADVKQNGDEALKRYAEKFDGYTGKSLEVSQQEMDIALNEVGKDYVEMLQRAIKNITAFHTKQLRKGFEIKTDDYVLGQKVTAVQSAGVYVPGGTAAYPSTVLMNIIPAKIAGVEKVVMATPVKQDGKVKSEVLVAAKLCGVDKIFKMGGAQAIAALAYGTETVPRCDKITGPGNAYVATAKKLVYGVCGIDMIAGPSEILVLADGTANADWVAADMLSQAEHDKLASALLITDSMPLAKAVGECLKTRVEAAPRRSIAEPSITQNGKIIVCENLDVAVKLANEYAPEHLELCVANPLELLKKVRNAGSVFLGHNTPEAVGDYYGGANHTLPTSGTARFASPLGVEDFLKTTQYIYYTPSALAKSADDIVMFAKSEGLYGHAESILARNKS